MNRHDLERAAALNLDLKNAERHLDALLSGDFKVVAITLGRDDGNSSSIVLERGRSGTGSVSSIGFSDGLKEAMTKAMYDHFLGRVEEAKAALESLGIRIAA